MTINEREVLSKLFKAAVDAADPRITLPPIYLSLLKVKLLL